ncbi:ATP-binding protein [Halalkalibacter nanhaiisediminis]|uniref:histidine kinase n=1 Tax=Halalkalibacter nanhaiisediminis TaxID=688079 RepID=A0A562QES5_9BACI|nr:ATP-binding protein [Halalkalibacter nanhaiisediminis]TWI55258.1 two-component system sporulation sensor kinase B [Halalkalibacter nanhaiisediminis]
MHGLESLLLNVLFIIIFLLFIPLLLEINSKMLFNPTKKNWIINFSASLGIILCILFPFSIIDGYIFDLRWVAVTIGGLYGGVTTIILLTGLTIAFRYFLGGVGVGATVLIGIVLMFILIAIRKMFRKSSKQKKLLVGTTVSLLAGVWALFVSIIIFDISFNAFFVFLYLILTFMTTLLVIYIYEAFQESQLINQRVIKAEKMEIVSHLASSMSHEVRNPLAVVRGFLQLMQVTTVSEKKQREYLSLSIEEIDRATDIIQNYLTFAKPSPENAVRINIEQELKRAINIITPLANINRIHIGTKLESCFILGDPQLLQQCLLNITKNCIEAMPNGGELFIETYKGNGELMIVISDEGEGMTKEQLSRLGEPYYTTKGREGTGLGMMAAMQIIEMMSGKLSVTSRVNEGTNFYIRFPTIEKQA